MLSSAFSRPKTQEMVHHLITDGIIESDRPYAEIGPDGTCRLLKPTVVIYPRRRHDATIRIAIYDAGVLLISAEGD